MKLGTPGFLGHRLREAREARGLTAMSLAEVIGLTRSAISLYEVAGKSPSPEVMKRISDVLQMPESYFRYPIRKREPGIIFYRSMRAATKSARRRAEQRYAWLREIVYFLRGYVQFPATRLPDLDVPADPILLSSDRIEKLAAEARSFYKMADGPIPNMVSLLENNGVIIVRDELGADTLDAFSEFDSEQQTLYMFLGTENASAVRSRFDVAHELGHALLHRTLDSVRFGRPAEYSLFEAQAHRFAAAFLLPAEAFANEFYSATLDSLQSIKAKWKVSIAMMIMRAQDLGFISEDTGKKLWIAYSRRKWRGNEPLDDSLVPEQPKLLRRSFELLLDKRILTKDHILTQLPFAPTDIERLSGLEAGFLFGRSSEVDQPVIVLNPSSTHKEPSLSRPGHGVVIKFPNKT